MVELKTCRVCEARKERTSFYRKKDTRDGFCNDCKECNSRKTIEWSKRNPSKRKAIAKRYREKRNPDILRGRVYESKYGVPKELVKKAILAAVALPCFICGSLASKRHCIDHNHKTKQFRGILCDPCNKGLGSFRDNPELMESAASYLRSPPGVEYLDTVEMTHA